MLRIVTKCEEMLQNVKNCYNSTNVPLGMKIILTPLLGLWPGLLGRQPGLLDF